MREGCTIHLPIRAVLWQGSRHCREPGCLLPRTRQNDAPRVWETPAFRLLRCLVEEGARMLLSPCLAGGTSLVPEQN